MPSSPLPNPFGTLTPFPGRSERFYYSLPTLEKQGLAKISRFPVAVRILLESLLRNCDGKLVHEEDIKTLLKWNPNKKEGDVPLKVARVLLQDFTGVPLLVDLAAMRDAAAALSFDPAIVEPQIPVDLIVDHSVQVDRSGTDDAFNFNLEIEQIRNKERYSFLKWGQGAFKTFSVVPPGIGICHQINIEHIAKVVMQVSKGGKTLIYPDTLVGTDSHTTMVNGMGVLGWGVGGIEAEAAMLGQPLFIQMPEVIGVHLTGRLKEGVTATDLTLRITELLRKEKVVDKLVEFFGEGAATLTVQDRVTIGNMAPEYGATTGFFPADDKTLEYMKMTGRSQEQIQLVKEYLTLQQMFGIPKQGQVDYTRVVELDLSSIEPCVAGPKRPQDRINLTNVKEKFMNLLTQPLAEGGYGKSKDVPFPQLCVHSEGVFSLEAKHITGGIRNLENSKQIPGWSEEEMVENRPFTDTVVSPGYTDTIESEMILTHGSVVIAAITSCTNTSNPGVMIGAGLLAKKAIEKGLTVNPLVKTSLAPGSRVVTDYLKKSGLQHYLDALGFHLVAYGCTTCIGNSGPLDERIEKAIKQYDLVVASVLSGNRNFEARVHGSVKANFLMSPPLVVAYAIAGTMNIDLAKDPLGVDKEGIPVFLKDIWPSKEEIEQTIAQAVDPKMFRERYHHIEKDNPSWDEIEVANNPLYPWEEESTYIRQPPYFEGVKRELPTTSSLKEMRALALFGDSITTDHISPAGGFRADTTAGKYLISLGIPEKEFNSYGSRRGNHLVMMRGTFANVRIRNHLANGKEGGYTQLLPDGEIMSIFDACEAYHKRNTPLIVFAGKDYGMGSSRDWAAKGSALLGVKAVVARSFERIHRSNLIGMGVLPLEFTGDDSWESLKITGEEVFAIQGIDENVTPGKRVELVIKRPEGVEQKVALNLRLDTRIEVDYYKHGGILPYVLRQLIR